MNKYIFLVFVFFLIVACKKVNPKPIGTNSVDEIEIEGFDCANVKTFGVLVSGQNAINTFFTISYFGGNGKSYQSSICTSTGVTGLKATLSEGKLANGDGVLNYSISGIPNSVGEAVFKINLGGKSCDVKILVVYSVESKYAENIKDIDGNSYKTVYIGSQQWMAENLKTTKFNDGTSIPNVKDSIEWTKLVSGAWCYHKNDENNNLKYGKLYNWYAVNASMNGNKNVCPSGWHVPSDEEWTVLGEYLGGNGFAGSKMKEVGILSWIVSNKNATNASLFTGLPGGSRTDKGLFDDLGYFGLWWSSSENNKITLNDENAMYRYLDFINDALLVGSYIGKKSGFSVRCLKD